MLYGTLIHKLNVSRCRAISINEARTTQVHTAPELAKSVSARWLSPLYKISINKPVAERHLMRHAFPNHISHANPCLKCRFVKNRVEVASSELLLDEERPQMGQLPSTRPSQNHQLDHHPSHDTGVCGLGLVSEFSFSFLECKSVF